MQQEDVSPDKIYCEIIHIAMNMWSRFKLGVIAPGLERPITNHFCGNVNRACAETTCDNFCFFVFVSFVVQWIKIIYTNTLTIPRYLLNLVCNGIIQTRSVYGIPAYDTYNV